MGIFFFKPQPLQKQTNNLSAACWVFPPVQNVCTRLCQNIWYVSCAHSQTAGTAHPAGDICLFCNVCGLKNRVPLNSGILSRFVQIKSVLFSACTRTHTRTHTHKHTHIHTHTYIYINTHTHTHTTHANRESGIFFLFKSKERTKRQANKWTRTVSFHNKSYEQHRQSRWK